MMPADSSSKVFNPLDILATAASLSQTKAMTQQQDTAQSENSNKDNVTNSSQTMCSDLEKMFDEHNYGNSKKVVVNKISHSSFSSDLIPKGKETPKWKEASRKVIVTVVNRSGDQRVVKTFSSIKKPINITGEKEEKLDSSAEKSSVAENLLEPCNGKDNSLSEISDTCIERNCKPSQDCVTDVPSLFQQSLNSSTGVNLKSIHSPSISTEQNTCQAIVVNNSEHDRRGNSCQKTNKEQVNIDCTSVNSDSPRQCNGDSSVVINPSNHHSAEILLNQDTGKQQSEISTIILDTGLDKRQTSNKHLGEDGPVSGSEEHLQNEKEETQSNCKEDLGKCEETNYLTKQETNNKDCAISQVDFSEDKKEKKDNSGNETEKPCDVSNKHSVDMLSEISPGDVNKLDCRLPSCDEVTSPDRCFFKSCEDTSDSESWRYEGNRADVRLSLDLDSPKSERNDNMSPCEMGKVKIKDNQIDDALNVKSNEEISVSENPETSKWDNSESVFFNDHSYAGISQDKKESSDHSESDVLDQSSQDDPPKNGLNIIESLLLRTRKNGGSNGQTSLSDINKARDAIVAVMGSESMIIQNTTTTPPKEVSPKFGKYRIGTFASVSNSAIGLESPTKKVQVIPGGKATSLLTNTVYTNSVPLVITQGTRTSQFSDMTLQQVLERKWVSVVDHDHDYCLPRVAGPANSKRRKEEKKVKVMMQDDSTDTESNDEFIPDEDSLPYSPPTFTHNINTRQKVKSEKVADYVKAGTSDSKLKITGKFQDDYIYFLNTKLRSRRRTTSQDQNVVPPNKLLLPLPKPGDIVVPHLTDADLELIKSGNHDKIPQQTCSKMENISGVKTLKPVANSGNSNTTPSNISDEENKIINTILSMESGDQTQAPSTEIPNFGETPTLFGGNNDDILNLTPEQMEILYSAMDEVQSQSPDISTSETKFNIDVPTSVQSPASSSDQQMLASSSKGNVSDSTTNTASEIPSSNTESTLAIPSLGDSVSTPEGSCLEIPVSTPAASELAYPVSTSSVTDLNIPTVEKSSLDLFESELKLFPDASIESSSTLQTKSVVAPVADLSDSSAPWIVTVSMYWNDLPAIMIDNAPFVRLVDIHKQILPAKDTGILKKRCQLLGIDVLNCTEMQRYFLVQYGKAFSSKSTLIITKENAKSLIGYYVNPGSHPQRVPRRPVAGKPNVSVNPSPQKIRKSSPVLKKKEAINHLEIPAPAASEVVPENPQSRTRHKKINFLEMLKGDTNNNSTVESTPAEGKDDVKVEKHRKSATKNKSEVDSKLGQKEKKHTETVEKRSKSVQNGDVIKKQKTDHNLEKKSSNVPGLKCEPFKKDRSPLVKKLKIDKSKKVPGPLKVKWTVFSNNKLKSSSTIDDISDMKENVLSVIHKDMTKSGQPERMQAGNVFLNLYKRPFAPCIKCCTCEKLFSIDNFLKHLHDISGTNKLLVVRQPQTFALRDLSPSDVQKKLWEHFFKKRKAFNDELKQKRQERLEKEKLTDETRKLPDVRISGRKRKPKQLHPIENYRYGFSKNLPQSDDSNAEVESCGNAPPLKIKKIEHNLTHAYQKVNGMESSESVVTLANGPEVISFTALENGFDV